MKRSELRDAVCEHRGEFLCHAIHGNDEAKVVRFSHRVTEPVDTDGLPSFGRLSDFYHVFGSVLFYHDLESGDAARYLAPPSSWAALDEEFRAWLEDLSEDEREEILPEWIETRIVIGETPHSGNYVLVPSEGPERGHVYEFDHDGFEFTRVADDVVEYVQGLLSPGSARLMDMASHMRFMTGDGMKQWWIVEFKDNRGNVVTTGEPQSRLPMDERS